jgi:hypothetical protein
MKFVVEIPLDNAEFRTEGEAVDLHAVARRLERVAAALRDGRFLRSTRDVNGNLDTMRCEIVHEPDAAEGSPR